MSPSFQEVGGSAYKPGLERMLRMSRALGNPHLLFPAIHVGGTNGKGSTASTLASVLQAAGYKTGLFTSPHLFDFRERMRINGAPISEAQVVAFVEHIAPQMAEWQPSFFEITTLMAFCYFARQEVEVAVVEVGMGGRLDCTNIIRPLLSVITNVSLDHTQYLGNTIEQIAYEKAGIIKPQTPVVIGEAAPAERAVFTEKARQEGAPVFFAEECDVLRSALPNGTGLDLDTTHYGSVYFQLGGAAQQLNARTILTALQVLAQLNETAPAAANSNSAPSDGAPNPSGAAPSPSEQDYTPCDIDSASSGAAYTPSEGMSTPSGAAPTSSAGAFVPSAGVSTPSAGVSTPSAGVFTPSAGVFTPHEGASVPPVGTPLPKRPIILTRRSVAEGFASVIERTGLRGRWELLARNPRIFCDTGHNPAGIALVRRQLEREQYKTLRIVFGMAADKDVDSVLALLPSDAVYYFCAPHSQRALPAQALALRAERRNLRGQCYDSVAQAVEAARRDAHGADLIYIGGSNFVVSEIPQELIHRPQTPS